MHVSFPVDALKYRANHPIILVLFYLGLQDLHMLGWGRSVFLVCIRTLLLVLRRPSRLAKPAYKSCHAAPYDVSLHLPERVMNIPSAIPEVRKTAVSSRCDAVLTDQALYTTMSVQHLADDTNGPTVPMPGSDLIAWCDVQQCHVASQDWQIPLGRRFRALKVWFVLRTYGQEGLQNYLQHHLRLAKLFQSLVEADARFEITAPPRFGLICFALKVRLCEAALCAAALGLQYCRWLVCLNVDVKEV